MKRLLLPSLIVLALAAGWSFAAEIKTLDTTDASNTGSVMGLTNSTAPSAVDDRWRAFQGALGRYIADQASGLTVSSTSSTAYSVTGNDATTALLDGRLLIVEMTPTNSAVSPTLNVNNTGAKELRFDVGTSLAAGAIAAGERIIVSYDSANNIWQVLSGAATASGYSDPLTTRGDILTRGASATQRVAIGASGSVAMSNGTDTVFASIVSDSISTGAVEVGKIADGTDGYLLTWSAAGVATTVTAGAATQVLTSNGSGAVPTWQAASAGVTGCGFVSRSSPSGVATVDFKDLTFDNYRFIVNLVPVTDNVVLRLRVDTDNGDSFDAGSNYNWGGYYVSEAASQTLRGGSSSDHIELADGLGSGATEGISIVLQMLGRNVVAISQYFTFIRAFTHESGVLRGGVGTGMWDRSLSGDTSNDVDAVQFSFSSGNIESGTIDMFGCVNS